eukprot:CAMPEP_0201596982 /NCGR_PEP_ID=MMETSP0190_2-20130828/193568_1 /ASSEMBLY_ACC=CAM_ASM_000263 /TAXON_ID=37353 /ORGANISM="Rosalina sp." /LENGTH=131 /DNA_ID=CAMNT_0048057679 /DNA_START=619 /DNA_END=1010 /DNA_ORIENTATION=-
MPSTIIYNKPKPLSPITPHTPIIQHSDGLVLEAADTLTKKFTTTHKTVDLPSPNPVHGKKKKKNKNKKRKHQTQYSEEETNDDFDSDDSEEDPNMVISETYDEYNSMTQTEDESPVPENDEYSRRYPKDKR